MSIKSFIELFQLTDLDISIIKPTEIHTNISQTEGFYNNFKLNRRNQ